MTDPDSPTPAPAGANAVVDLVALLKQVSGPTPADQSPTAAATGPTTPPAGEPGTATQATAEAIAEPMFGDLQSFMHDYLAPVLERRIVAGAAMGMPWCPQWWKHSEAITRFYALWRAWETMRISDPDTGMSIWWRDHLDPHLAALTSEYGPLGKCSPDRGHVDTTPLPLEPIPHDVLARLPDYELRPDTGE